MKATGWDFFLVFQQSGCLSCLAGGAFSVSPALGWAGVKGPKGSDLSRQTEGVVVGLKATGASLESMF